MGVKPTTFHTRARRDQLVDLALEVIGEHGVQGLTISAVARRAGVSRGVVGYNVGDLDDLLGLVVARAYAAGREQVGPAVESGRSRGGPLAAVQAFVSASLDFYRDRPTEMRALREIFADPALVARAATPDHRRELTELAELVREGQREGAVAEGDTGLLGTVVRAALDHAAARIAAGEDADRLRADLADLVDRLLRP